MAGTMPLMTILARPVNNVNTQGAAHNPTTSVKPWTNNSAFMNCDMQVNTLAMFQRDDNFGPFEAADNHRLSTRAWLPMAPELISLEAETNAHFMKYIDMPVRLAWGFFPNLVFHYGIGPPACVAGANAAMTVDVMVCHHITNRPLIIGELKKPGVIRVAEWTGPTAPGLGTRRLQREMRAYAANYWVELAFIYD
ncbi:hypothetical protein LTR22_028490, partial [Elasticomyces elasticus]